MMSIAFEQDEEIIKWCKDPKNKENITLKLIEELFELGEVVTKTLTKCKVGHKISEEKLAEELGDVIVRIGLFLSSLEDEFTELVAERIDKKIQYIYNSQIKRKDNLTSLTEDEGTES